MPRPGSGSSSGSSNSGSQPGSHPGSQSGSGERFRVRCRTPLLFPFPTNYIGLYDQYIGDPFQSCKNACGFFHSCILQNSVSGQGANDTIILIKQFTFESLHMPSTVSTLYALSHLILKRTS